MSAWVSLVSRDLCCLNLSFPAEASGEWRLLVGNRRGCRLIFPARNDVIFRTRHRHSIVLFWQKCCLQENLSLHFCTFNPRSQSTRFLLLRSNFATCFPNWNFYPRCEVTSGSIMRCITKCFWIWLGILEFCHSLYAYIFALRKWKVGKRPGSASCVIPFTKRFFKLKHFACAHRSDINWPSRDWTLAWCECLCIFGTQEALLDGFLKPKIQSSLVVQQMEARWSFGSRSALWKISGSAWLTD